MVDLQALLAALPEEKGHAPGADQEYVNGWGIFALPFDSGHVLALRVFPQNDFSPYVAVWHRDPRGRWEIYVDGIRLDTACPRYFGPACDHTGIADIGVTWTDRNSLRIRMGEPDLDWTVSAYSTLTLRFFNAVGSRLPAASWRPRAFLRARERAAKKFGMGKIQLRGTMPSGHTGQLMPERMYLIDQSTAVFEGVDLGRPIRLPENPVIGTFPLPARGVLVKGGAVWDILDPVEYQRTRAETGSHQNQLAGSQRRFRGGKPSGGHGISDLRRDTTGQLRVRFGVERVIDRRNVRRKATNVVSSNMARSVRPILRSVATSASVIELGSHTTAWAHAANERTLSPRTPGRRSALG